LSDGKKPQAGRAGLRPGGAAGTVGTIGASGINYPARFIVSGGLVVLFALITALMLTGQLAGWESGVYAFLAGMISPPLTNVVILITDIGSPTALIVIVVALVLIPYTRHRLAIPVVCSAVLAVILTNVLKVLIARERPDILRLVTESGYGFPSGHAFSNAAFYVIVILIVFHLTQSRPIRTVTVIVGVLLPFLIGTSRIYLGVHYAGDVLAGWTLGVAVALFSDTLWCWVLGRWPSGVAKLPRWLRPA